VTYSERDGVSNLLTMDTTTLKPHQITQLFHSHIGWLRWIDDSDTTLSFDVTDDVGWVREDMVYNTIDKDGGDITEAGLAYGGWDQARERARDLLDMEYIGPAADGRSEVVSTRDEEKKSHYPVLYRFDPYTGALDRLGDNDGGIVDWYMDPSGAITAATAIDDKLEYKLLYRKDKDQPWSTVYTYRYGEPGIDPIGFDASGQQLYVTSDVGTDTRVLRSFDLATKTLGPILYQDPKSDISYVDFSFRTHAPVYVTHGYESEEDTYLDPKLQEVSHELAAQLGQARLNLQPSVDRSVVLVYAYVEPYPGTYYIYRPAEHKLVKLFDVSTRFPQGALAPQKFLTIKARDGVMLPSYITTPVTGHGPWPMVLMVHGGPFGVRDVPGFDSEVQLLASQGYAVLQVNFRGSGGFGRGFEQMGWKQWGKSIQDDLADAVHWAMDTGVTAKGRVCVYGASFGGYSALMSMARNPELFSCGISLAGVTDLDAMLVYEKDNDNAVTNAWFKRVLGDVKDDKAALDAQSPLYNIAALKAPLFIAHGTEDSTVPPQQSQEFVDKFRREGKTGLEYLVLPGEGHGVRQSAVQLQFYSEMLRFLDRYIGKQAAGSGT
jgi:dipeptidyl aminopeptidase/acylaminoacyl peptidase